MVERIRELLNRFPEDEAVVRQLIERNPDFDSLCETYHTISRALRLLEGAKDRPARASADGLRKRRTAVEEELLTRIEGHRPV